MSDATRQPGVRIRPRIGLALYVAIAATAIVWIGSLWTGSRDGSAARVRSELLWPELNALPERDRAVIASLGKACRLHEAPEERQAIVDCLRRGLPSAKVPEGVKELPKELDRLLSTSKPPA